MAIIITADSLCDMPEDLKKRYGVRTVPYHIMLDGRDYLDGVDLTPPELFKVYEEKKALPHTSAVNTGEYVNFFQPLLDGGNDILHFCLGKSLTSSYVNALAAAELLDGQVTVINSGNLSAAISLQMLDAFAMIAEGKTRAEIAAYFEANRDCYHGSFILETLTFLSAGGRCSMLTALAAGLLSIKPEIIVHSEDGSMTVGKKFRGSLKKACEKYVAHLLEDFPEMEGERCFVAHTGPETEIQAKAVQLLEESGRFKEVICTDASCTISSHCGPNTMGIFFKTPVK